MSTKALQHISKIRAGGFAQAVLLFLAEKHNGKTGRCDPSRETIAEFFNSPNDPCTVKRVDRALAHLRDIGAISSMRVPCERGVKNVYFFPGLDGEKPEGVAPTVGSTPEQGVAHTVGSTPRRGVAPTVGSTGSPHGGGGNRNMNHITHTVIKHLPLNERSRVCAREDDRACVSVSVSEEKKTNDQKPTTFPHVSMPDDWRDFCEREAPDIDPQRAFDEFRDYWISVDGRKNDWTAAWRNRIRGYRNAPDWKRTPVLKRTTGRTVNPDDYLPNSTMKRQSARDYSRGWDD